MISINLAIVIAPIILLDVVRSYDDYNDQLRDEDTYRDEYEHLLARATLLDEYDLLLGRQVPHWHIPGCPPANCPQVCLQFNNGRCPYCTRKAACPYYRVHDRPPQHEPPLPTYQDCRNFRCPTLGHCPHFVLKQCNCKPCSGPPSPPWPHGTKRKVCPTVGCDHPCRFLGADGCFFCQGRCSRSLMTNKG